MSWFKALGNLFETNTLRGQRDVAMAENQKLHETVAALQSENAALKAEIERMRHEASDPAKPLHYPRLGLP